MSAGVEVPGPRIAHLERTVEVFPPAAADGARRVLVAEELLWEAGLQPRVDDDRRAERGVIAGEIHRSGVDVRRGLESRERRPQEIDRARRGAPRLVGK